jgi:hypothetical protein
VWAIKNWQRPLSRASSPEELVGSRVRARRLACGAPRDFESRIDKRSHLDVHWSGKEEDRTRHGAKAMAAITRLSDLGDEDRRSLKDWVQDFAGTWHEGALKDRLKRLRRAPESRWRLLAISEMVKIDLRRRRQQGHQLSAQSYIKAIPELASLGALAAEMLDEESSARTEQGESGDSQTLRHGQSSQPGPPAEQAAGAQQSTPPSTLKMRPQFQKPASGSRDVPIAVPPPNRAAGAKASAAHAVEARSSLPPQFGRYRIETQLGQGGMGSVYKAFDTELHRHVALKVPQFAPQDGTEVLERFKQEARAAAAFRHSNMCEVYDLGVIDDTYFLTMEFVEGQTLEKYLLAHKRVPPRFVAELMTALARALQAAHSRSVIHRDLKPSNIMLRETEAGIEPVIVDFGLARRVDAGTARLTQSGLVIGTWQYMTPEQLCGEPGALGPSCDIYALGVIMYELLTGRPPFNAPGQVVRGNPVPPSTECAGLDARLEAICLKAMASQASDRFVSMGELASALNDYIRSVPESSPALPLATEPDVSLLQEPKKPSSPGFPESLAGSRKPIWIALAGGSAVIASALVGAVFWIFGGRAGVARRTESAGPVGDRSLSRAQRSIQAVDDPERLLEGAREAIRTGRSPLRAALWNAIWLIPGPPTKARRG